MSSNGNDYKAGLLGYDSNYDCSWLLTQKLWHHYDKPFGGKW